MVRRNDYETVEIIIGTRKEANQPISYELLSKQTKIRSNSLKKWLKIIELVQNSSLSINLTEKGISAHKPIDDLVAIRTRVKKRGEDPSIKEFLTEFKGVLSRTKASLEDEKIKNYPQLRSQPRSTPEYSDMQSELTQVLEQGLSFLSSVEQADKKVTSKTDGNFLRELKDAVNLGINNLEKVVLTDYKKKKGRVNEMKSELEMVFKVREKRLKEKSSV